MSSAAFGGNKISEASNLFTSDVYKEIIKNESGNIFFSSLSVEAILTLLYCGAEGCSAYELETILRLSGRSPKQIQNDTRSILDTLRNKRGTRLANTAFVQENLALNKPFLNVARDNFFAKRRNVNFAKSQKAADTINKFVENRTNNLIKNLLNPNSLNAAAILVLVNSLRFKGRWSIPFRQSKTKKDDFYTPGKVIQVDTLHHHRKHFMFYQSADLKAKFLELPFKGHKASMVIVLPVEKHGLATLEEHIVKIATCEIPFKRTYINVALPKFKFEYKIDFKKILTQLGVSKIFDLSEADLSGIAGDKGDGAVGEIVQKAYIDLNEYGVEASAATYVRNCVELSAVVDETTNFLANQPFIFLLKYAETTIFAGRIIEPKY